MMTRLKILLAAASCVFTLAAAAQTRPPITGVSHISVYTSNPSETERFYVHDIGCFKGADPENSKGVRYYINPTQFVEVLPLPAGASMSRLDHLGYLTTNVQQLHSYLIAHGLKPSAVEKGSDGSNWFHVKDPEGNDVEFDQRPTHLLVLTGADPIGRHIIHVGMLVHSRDAENKFYRDLLGFRPYWYGGMQADRVDWVSQQVPDGHDWLEYMLDHSSAANPMTQKQLGVLNHFSIGVVNMEKSVTLLDSQDRLKNQRGGPQLGKDGKWQFNMYDPDGTRVELMEFTPVEKPCCSPFTAANPQPAE
jgi:catechol 2,3-dioxygenase-like lactoylglutathione lyase family enzyme